MTTGLKDVCRGTVWLTQRRAGSLPVLSWPSVMFRMKVSGATQKSLVPCARGRRQGWRKVTTPGPCEEPGALGPSHWEPSAQSKRTRTVRRQPPWVRVLALPRS